MKRFARLLAASTTGRLPAGAADRLHKRRLLRPVFTNIIINNITAALGTVNLSASTATSSANVRYVLRIPNNVFTMDMLEIGRAHV